MFRNATFASLILLLASATTALAGNDIDLSWYTVDGGGGRSTGGALSVTGTIGQPDAGAMIGGAYSLAGGFWHGDVAPVLTCVGDIVTSATFEPPPDGAVNGADLAYLLGEWGANPDSLADFVTSATFQPPPDGVVDGADLAVLLGAWGSCE